MPTRFGTTRGFGPFDSTTATVVFGVTVSPALRPGCSGTIQLMTVPAGTFSSNAGSDCVMTRSSVASLAVAWSSVNPTRSGSGRGAGPLLTTNSNGLDSCNDVDSPGWVRMTTPAATS